MINMLDTFIDTLPFQQRGLLNCLMLMLFAVKRPLLLGERTRSSRSSNIIRRFLSRVRCICRTRIEGRCCSSRDSSFAIAPPYRLLSFLRIRYAWISIRGETCTCTYMSRKRRAIFATALNFRHAAHFWRIIFMHRTTPLHHLQTCMRPCRRPSLHLHLNFWNWDTREKLRLIKLIKPKDTHI